MKQQKDWMASVRHNLPHSHYVHNKVGLTEAEGKSREREIIGYTDFFFVLEDFSGDPIKQGTTTTTTTTSYYYYFTTLLLPTTITFYHCY